MKWLFVFIAWTILVFSFGWVVGKNSAQKAEAQKNVQLYQKRESNTTEQEKKASEIKIKYERFKSKDEECNFVLDYNVASCLHK